MAGVGVVLSNEHRHLGCDDSRHCPDAAGVMTGEQLDLTGAEDALCLIEISGLALEDKCAENGPAHRPGNLVQLQWRAAM